LRDPWYCATCGSQTYTNQAGAAVAKVFKTILAIALGIILLLMLLGWVVSTIQGK
jgi:hypothetical protein